MVFTPLLVNIKLEGNRENQRVELTLLKYKGSTYTIATYIRIYNCTSVTVIAKYLSRSARTSHIRTFCISRNANLKY